MTWLEKIDKACQEALHEASKTPYSGGSKSVILKEGMNKKKMHAIQRRIIQFCSYSELTYVELPTYFMVVPYIKYELVINISRIYLLGTNRMCVTWYLR